MSEPTKFEYQIQILEYHLDTFGHVNNAVYFELYEQTRWDFITKNGYGLKEVHERQQGPVVLDVSCRFKRELVNREMITIKSQSEPWKGKIGRIKQEMYKADGTLASDATFTFGFMDFAKRKLIDPPLEWLQAIGLAE